jgi:PhnB protein
MASSAAPEGYSTVSPYLIVAGARETIDFAQSVFDAEPLRSFPDESGKLVHAEFRIGDSVVMVADGAGGWPPVPAHVHVYVADVDAVYRKALEAGAEGLQEPVRRDDPDRRGGFRDPAGTTWWIATREE